MDKKGIYKAKNEAWNLGDTPEFYDTPCICGPPHSLEGSCLLNFHPNIDFELASITLQEQKGSKIT